MFVNGQQVSCTLDGLSIGCSTAMGMLGHSAIPAELDRYQRLPGFSFEDRGLGIFTWNIPGYWTSTSVRIVGGGGIDDSSNDGGLTWNPARYGSISIAWNFGWGVSAPATEPPTIEPPQAPPTAPTSQMTCSQALAQAGKTLAGLQRALSALPQIMQSVNDINIARLLAAIGIQESDFQDIPQKGGGPGRGIFQIEPKTYGIEEPEARNLSTAVNAIANNWSRSWGDILTAFSNGGYDASSSNVQYFALAALARIYNRGRGGVVTSDKRGNVSAGSLLDLAARNGDVTIFDNVGKNRNKSFWKSANGTYVRNVMDLFFFVLGRLITGERGGEDYMQRYEKVFLFGVLSALLIGCAGTIARVDTQSPEPMRDSSTPNTRPTPNSTSGIWADRLVAPGVGTNSVRLGMSRDELVALLDKPNEEYDQKGLCTYSEMHWYLTNPDQSVGGDIFAFLRDGKVFELMFGDGFYTSAGIRYNTGLEDLKEKIGAPIFELTKSSNTATNYQNLFFMIEKEKGIAYEIAAGYKTKKRGVSAIYVFYPNNDFLPWGCIDEIQNLVKISGSP